MHEEKRKFPRANINMLIEYANKNTFIKDYSSNISGGGLFIATTNTFPLGTELLIRFSIPGIGNFFEITGEVVWVNNYDDTTNNVPGMGIKFKDINKESQEIIIKYVEKKFK